MVYLIIDGYLEAVIGQLVVADLQIKLLVPSTIEQQYSSAEPEVRVAEPVRFSVGSGLCLVPALALVLRVAFRNFSPNL